MNALAHITALDLGPALGYFLAGAGLGAWLSARVLRARAARRR